ncbi:MAG: hypothetical protein M1400_02950 [Patescibacteria group bacterium]|nr:hypothetical protein [Patescibacteria group bacterium]
MAEYNQEQADARHRERRDRLQSMRNELSDILNDYYERFPEGPEGERDLEYRIEEKLRAVERDIDSFVREFKNLPNE